MKIKSKAGELQIEVYSRFLFRFWGWVFIAAGLFFLSPLFVQYEISCKDKSYNSANECILTTNFLEIYIKNDQLGSLKSASVSNCVEGGSNSIFYCLVLNSSEGTIKIPGIKSRKNFDIVSTADTVNNYLKTSLDKNITIPKIEDGWSFLKVALFLSLGFGSLLFRLITLHFNKKTRTIRIAAKNIINTHETKIALDDVEKLIIEEHGKFHKEYSLALILKGGEQRHLPGIHDSCLQTIEDLAQQIRPYLQKE